MSYPNIIQQINSKLPLSGGSITGTLYFTDRGMVTGNHSSSPNKSLEIYADTDGWEGNGCGIAMRSKDAEATDRGMITIRAGDGTTTSNIRLTPNGAFTHNGNEVVVVNGNTIKGDIKFDTGIVSSNIANEFLLFANTVGDTSSNYSCIAMRTELHTSPGSFYIRSRNNSNNVQSIMILQPDGTFTWNGKPIVVLTESYKSGSTGYRRYSDGYTEQWGYTTSIANNASVSVTLPIAMKTTGYNISTNIVRGSSYVNHISASGRTTTSFTLFNYRSYSSSTNSVGCLWYVCGY